MQRRSHSWQRLQSRRHSRSREEDMGAIAVPGDTGAMMEPRPDGTRIQAASQEMAILPNVQRSFELVRGRGSDLSVVVAGLDGLRVINERQGPIEGDPALAAFWPRRGGM